MRKKQVIRNCPVCDWNEAVLLHEQKFILSENHPLPDQYDVVSCARCNFVYADTPASQEAYDFYYAEFSKYADKNTSMGSGETAWDAKRLKFSANQLTAYLPSAQARILDVGCAQGGLLNALRTNGFDNLMGIDPSLQCVENVRKAGIEARQTTLLHGLESKAEFDCVILSHILEHIKEVRLAIQIIHAATKFNGVVYIEVPDVFRYAEQASSPFQDFNTEHINHFSITSLTNLMGSFGFDLINYGEKEVEFGPNTTYPVLFSFWRKVSDPVSDYPYTQDTRLIASMSEYIQKSDLVLGKMDRKIRAALDKSSNIIVWGTGQLAFKLLAETCLREANILAFVDSNPIHHNQKINQVSVRLPDEIVDSSCPILIASILHQKEIVDTIVGMGLNNGIICLGDQE